MNIYNENSYKRVLQQALQQKKTRVSSRFTHERMAQACGVQKTYLSRVMNSDKAHLSEEQLHLAASYLGIPKEEREFLHLLRRRERASARSLQEELDADIKAIRQRERKTDRYIGMKKTAAVSDRREGDAYYLDPLVMLVHIFMTVRKFREDLPQLAKALQIERERLNGILVTLEALGLIRLSDGGYIVLNKKTHLASDSPLYRSFRSMQRLHSLNQLSRLSEDKSYSLSVAFSSNPEIKSQIHDKLLKVVGEIEALVSGSTEEEVYQLNVDLFDWT